MKKLSIKRLPSQCRPRERLLKAGPAALSEVELVALVIGGDLDGAATLIARLGGARGIRRALLRELQCFPGIGFARASQLVAAFELARRAQEDSPELAPALSTPSDVAAQLHDLCTLEQEELHVLGLDTRHRLLLRFVAARGSLNVVHVAPREVFRRLIREGASAAIVAHNHPSGDPAPSREDRALTMRLRAAGDLVGIPLLDHIVIATSGFHSFAEPRR